MTMLQNLFLHYAFDEWMRRNHPTVQFERYADDVIVHAATRTKAETLLGSIRDRLKQCRLDIHPDKTQIVYCQDSDRRQPHDQIEIRLSRVYLSTSASTQSLGEVLCQLPPRGEHEGCDEDPGDDTGLASWCQPQQSIPG